MMLWIGACRGCGGSTTSEFAVNDGLGQRFKRRGVADEVESQHAHMAASSAVAGSGTLDWAASAAARPARSARIQVLKDAEVVEIDVAIEVQVAIRPLGDRPIELDARDVSSRKW